MRTAEEILNDYDADEVIFRSSAIAAIYTARKEAIEECSERAEVELVQISENDFRHTSHVDKKSILSLIDELK